MNQLNPLHIGALLLVILVFSFFKLNEAQTQLVTLKDSFKESEKLAIELSALKDVYGNKIKTQKALERILKQPSVRNANLQIKRTKRSLHLSGSQLDQKVLNSLMSKILNGNYDIVKLKIEKQDATHASLNMEIKW